MIPFRASLFIIIYRLIALTAYPLFLAAFVGVFQANIQLKNGGFCVIIIYKNGKKAKIFTVTQPFCAFSYLMGERRQKNKQVKERKKDEKRFRNERRNAR